MNHSDDDININTIPRMTRKQFETKILNGGDFSQFEIGPYDATSNDMKTKVVVVSDRVSEPTVVLMSRRRKVIWSNFEVIILPNLKSLDVKLLQAFIQSPTYMSFRLVRKDRDKAVEMRVGVIENNGDVRLHPKAMELGRFCSPAEKPAMKPEVFTTISGRTTEPRPTNRSKALAWLRQEAILEAQSRGRLDLVAAWEGEYETGKGMPQSVVVSMEAYLFEDEEMVEIDRFYNQRQLAI